MRRTSARRCRRSSSPSARRPTRSISVRRSSGASRASRRIMASRLTPIDRAAKRVTFADGHAEYDTLFLSTGTRARDLPLPGARPRWRVLAAQDRRRARAARPARRRQAHRHRRWRLYRARGRGGRAQRGQRGHGARGRGARDEARHLAGDLALHAGLPSQSRRRHPPRRAARRDRGRARRWRR